MQGVLAGFATIGIIIGLGFLLAQRGSSTQPHRGY